MLACGQAAAQGTYGTKVNAGDPDVGLPLSPFAPIGGIGGVPPVTTQFLVFVSFWDVGATPGLFDNQDVVYLQFGSSIGTATRIVRANNIRLTGWGNYPAGSYVKPGDSDIGQQLLPSVPPNTASFRGVFVPQIAFGYMEVDGGQGYGLRDPVYLDLAPAVAGTTDTNDVRITSFAGFPAGSRVSNADSDAARPLLPFFGPFPANPNAGPVFTFAGVNAVLSFYNANGNILPVPPNSAVFDDGDVVYFDVNPIGSVSPNDIRLY
jgi:hypothetical protein